MRRMYMAVDPAQEGGDFGGTVTWIVDPDGAIRILNYSEEPKMNREVYKSTTHGEIPLSFTGRHLLQNLRHAATAAIKAGNWHYDCDALSKARGELALYMSRLEARKEPPKTERTLVGVHTFVDFENPTRMWLKRVFSDGHISKVLAPRKIAVQIRDAFVSGKKAGERAAYDTKDVD